MEKGKPDAPSPFPAGGSAAVRVLVGGRASPRHGQGMRAPPESLVLAVGHPEASSPDLGPPHGTRQVGSCRFPFVIALWGEDSVTTVERNSH